jgi:hypothetical protein
MGMAAYHSGVAWPWSPEHAADMGVILSSKLKSISSLSETLPSADDAVEGGTGIVMPFSVPVDIYIFMYTTYAYI